MATKSNKGITDVQRNSADVLFENTLITALTDGEEQTLTGGKKQDKKHLMNGECWPPVDPSYPRPPFYF